MTSIAPSSKGLERTYPEIAVLGRSNVGKSTFINALLSQKLAFSSKTAGKTKLLNYFLIDEAFYLVDTPGYGYTAFGNREDLSFAALMETYFERKTVKGALLLLDIRRDKLNEDDEVLLDFLKDAHVPTIVIFTKGDKANQSITQKARKMGETLGVPVYVSDIRKDLGPIKGAIASLLEGGN